VNREEFERRHAEEWSELEDLLAALQGGRARRSLLGLGVDAPGPERFGLLYRIVCRHLVLSRQRLYGTDLVDRLNDLALRAHRHLYGQRRGGEWAVTRFVLASFPAAVRARAGAVAFAAALFFLPVAGMARAVILDPPIVRTVIDPASVGRLEEMYDPRSSHFSRPRASDTNLGMFGFYIYNNVGIAFRTFAGGILFGAGSIFFLVYNGLAIGASMGYLAEIGYGRTFFPFVAGHAALELGAIVLSGAAGLNLGWSLIAPGRRTRVESLRRAAGESVVIVYGVLLMLVAAAFVEAFWSPLSGTPDTVKYAAGAALWIGTLVYFAFVGRADGS
jgi:uncharacterized membrane protein SpoIIM required for sporulation